MICVFQSVEVKVVYYGGDKVWDLSWPLKLHGQVQPFQAGVFPLAYKVVPWNWDKKCQQASKLVGLSEV